MLRPVTGLEGQFSAQFGGKASGAKIFEAGEQDKARIDAYLAATDLLEAMALTPWCISLNEAVSVASSYSIRSVSTMAKHFERFAHAEATQDQSNKKIADYPLLLPDNSQRTAYRHSRHLTVEPP